jgi:GntR family transcriptional regulator, carbon starvation induced regulator
MDLAMTLVERIEEQEAVGDDGYRRIRTDIVFGRLRPGQKLRLDGLKEDYGVSVSTLREILNRLAAEGFVLAEGRRGFEVAPVSVENLKELAELRLLLETHAMGVSFANADVEWEGRVVSAHHKLASTDRLMESGLGELEQWKRYDGEFHQALISNCGSRTLMEMHALVFDKYFRYQMIAFSYRGSEPAEQHKALLEAALKRDAKTATATLRTHVNNCVEHALATASLK